MNSQSVHTQAYYLDAKDHFYNVDVEISNYAEICRNLTYFFQFLGGQEFQKFLGPNQPYKKRCLGELLYVDVLL